MFGPVGFLCLSQLRRWNGFRSVWFLRDRQPWDDLWSTRIYFVIGRTAGGGLRQKVQTGICRLSCTTDSDSGGWAVQLYSRLVAWQETSLLSSFCYNGTRILVTHSTFENSDCCFCIDNEAVVMKRRSSVCHEWRGPSISLRSHSTMYADVIWTWRNQRTPMSIGLW